MLSTICEKSDKDIKNCPDTDADRVLYGYP